MEISLCSDCFQDPGLRLDAKRAGIDSDGACPVCGSVTGRKLDKQRIASVAKSFFVWGTMSRSDYGPAPVVQFNEHQKTSITAESTNVHTNPVRELSIGDIFVDATVGLNRLSEHVIRELLQPSDGSARDEGARCDERQHQMPARVNRATVTGLKRSGRRESIPTGWIGCA